MRYVALAVLLAGCNYNPRSPSNPNDDAPLGDEAGVGDDANQDRSDAFVQNDGPIAADCYGEFVTICLPAIPSGQIQINGGGLLDVDTDSTVSCLETAIGTTVNACVLAGTNVSIDGQLIAHGSRPLAVIALGNLQINGSGRLDVASRRGRPQGAGARATCPGTVTAQASGGGFGGTYQQPGGNGGTGDSGSGGIAAGARLLETLEAGCPGGANLALGTSAGPGGGAVVMIASVVKVDGTVNASGEGGEGGGPGNNGGGGGGSGGLIVADSPSFTINGSGRLIAQGGGGGEGGTVAVGGDDGDDPSVGTAAAGGRGLSVPGGDGGDGAVLGAGSPGLNGAAVSGGGGGGGGVGFIVRRASGSLSSTGQTFPALTTFWELL